MIGPILFWRVTLDEVRKLPSTKDFLRRILPFSALSGLIQAVGVSIVFALSPDKTATSNTPAVLTFIALGYIFFAFALSVYSGAITANKRNTIIGLGVIETVLLFFLFKIPALMGFFNLTQPPEETLEAILAIVLIFGFLQGIIARYFVQKELAIQ